MLVCLWGIFQMPFGLKQSASSEGFSAFLPLFESSLGWWVVGSVRLDQICSTKGVKMLLLWYILWDSNNSWTPQFTWLQKQLKTKYAFKRAIQLYLWYKLREKTKITCRCIYAANYTGRIIQEGNLGTEWQTSMALPFTYTNGTSPSLVSLIAFYCCILSQTTIFHIYT